MPPIDVLFIHQNMPGQFRHLAPAIANIPGYRVLFLTRREGITIPNVISAVYKVPEVTEKSPELFARPVENSVRFGRQAALAALDMKKRGVNPKLIIVHPGWGEALFMRDVWPEAKILTFAEYYYREQGGDIGFDPLFPKSPNILFNARMMNANLLLSHEAADALISPTHWQKSRHPEFLQQKTRVIFDGVDTERVKPVADARFALPNGRVLDMSSEVITYCARNLEPHRGFHVFMKSLPQLLAARPQAEVVVVGGTEVSYSPKPPAAFASWKEKLEQEVSLGEHASRVHFVGKLPYADYLSLLSISSAHLYLTYPFVLSWSCVEAMAAGCMMIASDTSPVREVIKDGENGLLFPFFDEGKLVETVCRALDDRALSGRLRANARATVVKSYDLRDCLRQQLLLVQELIHGPVASRVH